jgi:hypothetical protein
MNLRHLRYFFLAIVFLLAVAFVVLPGFLLEKMLNQDYPDDDSYFSAVRTGTVKLSPLLDELTLTDVTLTPQREGDQPLTIAEVRITDMNRLKLVKALLGFGGDAFEVLREGQLTILRLANAGLASVGLEHFSLGGLAIDGLSFDAESSDLIKGTSFHSLKLSDLALRFADKTHFSAEAMSFFELREMTLGGMMLGSLNASFPGPQLITGADLNNASLANLDFPALLSAFLKYAQGADAGDPVRTTAGLLDMVGVVGNVDLSGLTLTSAGEELFFLGKIQTDQIASEGGPTRILLVENLALALDRLEDRWPTEGLEAALVRSLPPRPVLYLSFRSGPEGAGFSATKTSLTLNVDESLDLDLTLRAAGLSGGDPLSMLLSMSNLNLEPGQLNVTDLGLLTRLKPNLSEFVFESADSEKALLDLLPSALAFFQNPKEDDRPLNSSILELELARFIVSPVSLSLSWEPTVGYPGSVIDRTPGGLSGLAAALVRGDMSDFEDKYKYPLLNELNLSLSANGRAPVSVYLGPRS